LATEKKKKLVASWHLPKKVNFKTLLLTIDFIGLYMQVPLCKQGFGTDEVKLSISFTKMAETRPVQYNAANNILGERHKDHVHEVLFVC